MMLNLYVLRKFEIIICVKCKVNNYVKLNIKKFWIFSDLILKVNYKVIIRGVK